MRMPLVPVRCARCGFPAPVDDDELFNPGSNPERDGDEDAPDLPVLLIPPAGWILNPDDVDGIIHRRCAFPEELEAYELELLNVEAAMMQVRRDDPDDDDE